MRLIWKDGNGVFKLTQAIDDSTPYAILSHTWGEDADEVTYQDLRDATGQEKAGWEKIRFCAERTKEAGLKYFWIDTCCIDKRNDAELSTAIRSMFRWYAKATVCFVYLADVSFHKRSHDGGEPWRDTFRNCRWLKRGWTLQELIAPQSVQFYARDDYLGDRSSLCQLIHEITGIETSALLGNNLDTFSHHARLQWASRRETKVNEDLAYSLMGLCGISMSPRYGEGGQEARRRLERKIAKQYGTVALEVGFRNTQATDVKEHRRTMLKWLAFDVMDSRRTTIKKALVETCRWILSEPCYMSWSQPEALQQHHGFFWVQGKPGAGKSVMMKFLETHTQKSKDDDDICISWYFNARGESLEKSLVGMYRSLIHQLLSIAPELQDVLDGVSKVRSESGQMVDTLQRTMLNACLTIGRRRLYCFIDALDECREQDVSSMVEFFRDLGESAVDAGTSVFVCFASRHYPILDIPTGLKLVLEDVEQHTRDLERYVRHHLRVGTKKQCDQITQDILTKANGVFLWVILVVDILKKEFQNGRIHAVRKRLDEVPPGLTELFQQITRRDQENVEELLLCLEWILYAGRPLELPEFYFAMLASLNCEQLEWDSDLVTEEQMHRYLLSSSKGLVELTKGKAPRAQFIHESVRDYLLAGEGFKHIEHHDQTSASQVHETLKQCCLRGIACEGGTCRGEMGLPLRGKDIVTKAWKPSKSEDARTTVTRRFPFLEYSVNFVLFHADQAALDVPQDAFLENFDISDWAIKANFLQKHDINLYKKIPDVAYVCAERDHSKLIKLLAQQGRDLNRDTSQRNASPLFAAFAWKSKNAAHALLEQDGAASPQEIVFEVICDSPRGRLTHDRQQTRYPFKWALEYGYTNLALHLSRGVDLNMVAPSFGAIVTGPLWLAARSGYHSMVAILLDRSANIDAVDLREHTTALEVASKRGHKEVVRMLMARGAQLRHALRHALVCGDVEIVRMLLDAGADANTSNGMYANTLQAASEIASLEVVQMLIDAGEDVNAQEGHYGNALQAASGRGLEEIVRVLLDAGADPNLRGVNSSSSALQLASSHGWSKVVRMLIDAGADVNAQGGYYGNALQAASWKGSKEIVQTLINANADVNAQGGHYGNARQAAIQTGVECVVWMLEQAGAVAGMSDSDQSTPDEGGDGGTNVEYAPYSPDNEIILADMEHPYLGPTPRREHGWQTSGLCHSAAGQCLA